MHTNYLVGSLDPLLPLTKLLNGNDCRLIPVSDCHFTLACYDCPIPANISRNCFVQSCPLDPTCNCITLEHSQPISSTEYGSEPQGLDWWVILVVIIAFLFLTVLIVIGVAVFSCKGKKKKQVKKVVEQEEQQQRVVEPCIARSVTHSRSHSRSMSRRKLSERSIVTVAAPAGIKTETAQLYSSLAFLEQAAMPMPNYDNPLTMLMMNANESGGEGKSGTDPVSDYDDISAPLVIGKNSQSSSDESLKEFSNKPLPLPPSQ